MSTNNHDGVGDKKFEVPPEMLLTQEEVEQFNAANNARNLKIQSHVEARDEHLYPALETGQGLSQDELQAHLSDRLKQLPPDVLRSLHGDDDNNNQTPPSGETPVIKTIRIEDVTDGISGGGGNRPPVHTPEQVYEVVDRRCNEAGLKPLPKDINRDAVEGEFNALFGTYKKAMLFFQSYMRIFMCLDFIYLSEITKGFVGMLSEKLGFVGLCGRMNSRHQAVGILINPLYWEVIAWWEIFETADDIQGIQDLRPHIVALVRNRLTGKYELKVSLHLKSMMGGVEFTAKIRFQQNLRLIEHLHTKLLSKLIELVGEQTAQGLVNNLIMTLAGDWNCKGPNRPEMKPIHDDGFAHLFPGDNAATHMMGGQLDFPMGKNIEGEPHDVQHVAFYDDLQRTFSDHKLKFWYVRQKSATVVPGADTTSGAQPNTPNPDPKPDTSGN